MEMEGSTADHSRHSKRKGNKCNTRRGKKQKKEADQHGLTCMIHCSNDHSKLIQPADLNSWDTLLTAAKIREHNGILEIAKNVPSDEMPAELPWYHKLCRQRFTMKRDLEDLKKQKEQNTRETSVESTQSQSRKSIHGKPPASTVYERICMICQKSTKYLAKTNSKAPLVVCQELRADSTLREAAVKKGDNRVIALLSRDLVAAEGNYHKICYSNYTRCVSNTAAKSTCSAPLTKEEEAYLKAKDDALQELYSYIRNHLFPDHAVVPITTLVARLESSLKSKGFDKLDETTKYHLRRKLEAEFGDALHIVSNTNGRLLVYPDAISKDEFAQLVYKLQQERDTLQTLKGEELLKKAALLLRTFIKQFDFNQTWPPDIEDFQMPPELVQFLYTSLTGDVQSPELEGRVKRLISSLGSDFIYAVSHGRVKPPKHILLASAVKTLTGSVELITIINRLCHGISYTQLEEIDTALCLQKLAQVDEGTPLPEGIMANIPTTVVYDNIDRLEETITGAGTSHRVNGIIVQPKACGPFIEKQKPIIPKVKQRSIAAEPPLPPIYNAGRKVGPPCQQAVDIDTSLETHEAKVKNCLWVLSRLLGKDSQTVSSWTGFNILIRDDIEVIQDMIAYLPTINAPATDMSTIHAMLCQVLQYKNTLELEKMVCVFDQAIFAKVTELVWKHPEFQDLIIRMGDFHLVGNLLSTIGKRFQDAGLRELCVEAGVVVEGSISGVMEGRQYNRGIRTHKLVYEALMRLMWEQFVAWLEETHTTEYSQLEEVLDKIEEFQVHINSASFGELQTDPKVLEILSLFMEYTGILRSQNKLAEYWMSYLDMVEVLLGLLRAAREGNWLLHLAMVRKTIPWCFAYDKINYARFLPYYYATMSRLQLDDPDVYEEFMRGRFSVQIGDKNPFGRIPFDQTIEETVNKDTQTAGGTKGFSFKGGAIRRYYINAEYRSHYLRRMWEMVGQSESKLNHPDLQSTRIKKDASQVAALVDLLGTSWINPFDPDNDVLVNLASGSVAPANITKDLIEAESHGEKAYETFKTERLESDLSHEKYHQRLTKLQLKTFSDLHKKKRISSSQEIVLNADRKLFAQMILVAENRKLDMKEVLSHPLGPLPWSLSYGDGSIRTTAKNTLAKEIVKLVAPAEDIPQSKATIIDGMAMVQKLKGNDKTFSDLANSLLNNILRESHGSQRVDVVFDTYKKPSIKDPTRTRRGEDRGIHFSHIAPGHSVQQWRKLLRCGSSKASLIRFLVSEWQKAHIREKLADKTLFVTCDDKCWKINASRSELVSDLQSSHQEADTCILLHTLHAANSGYDSVVISADDTDIMVIALATCSSIPCTIFWKTGKKNRTEYIEINTIHESLWINVCEALVGMHAFTGCDNVSSFAGKGKITAFNLLKSNEAYQTAYKELGQYETVSETLYCKLEEITCAIYQRATPTTSVNDLRYHIFCVKPGECESSTLPPCQDCLYLHIMRANYVAFIWRKCLEVSPCLPNPLESGWVMEDGHLTIKWMQGSPAPEAVLQLIACKCTRTCKEEFPCVQNGLKCTDMCKKQDCVNQGKEDEPQIDMQEIDVSDDDDDDDDDGEDN